MILIQHATKKFFPNCTRSTTEMTNIDAEIKKLSSKRVIEPTSHYCNEVIFDAFVNTHRKILNLNKLNQHANKLHCKMDILNTITKLVDKDCFMASTDPKDAYYSVPMAAPYRKYLRFSWRGNLYQFTCSPNGLFCGPRKFTKLLKPALSDLHNSTIKQPRVAEFTNISFSS